MYEYPETDENGKKFRWASRKGGFKYRIYQKNDDLNRLSEIEKKYVEAYVEPEEKKVTKEEYGRLSHLIDSNSKKWRKEEINFQIIDDKVYYFRYYGFNSFEILDVEEWRE